MTGIAVVTTRLSIETMNRAIEVIANVQIVVLRCVIVSRPFPPLFACDLLLLRAEKRGSTRLSSLPAALEQAVRPGLGARCTPPSPPASAAPRWRTTLTASGDPGGGLRVEGQVAPRASDGVTDVGVVARGLGLQHQSSRCGRPWRTRTPGPLRAGPRAPSSRGLPAAKTEYSWSGRALEVAL